jgi:DNA polymerase (family 10)
MPEAEYLANYLKKFNGIKNVEVCGSYRRRSETIADLDILVTAKNAANAIKHFIKFEEISTVLAQGPTKATVRLRSGIRVDLRAVPQQSYGAALQYFTASKAHSIALRKIVVKKKLKLNEYGVFRGKKSIAGKHEEGIYHTLGLAYIEPELREDRGEIAAAKEGKLPKLIKLTDIRGDLHCHTKATDGRQTIEAMALAAAKRGYELVCPAFNGHLPLKICH